MSEEFKELQQATSEENQSKKQKVCETSSAYDICQSERVDGETGTTPTICESDRVVGETGAASGICESDRMVGEVGATPSICQSERMVGEVGAIVPAVGCQSENILGKQKPRESHGTQSEKMIGSNDQVTIVEAIHHKYSEADMYEEITILISNYAPGKTDSGNILVPPILSLNEANVTHCGNQVTVTQMCSHVRELDLAGNQLSDWSQVFNMVRCMPHLRFLNLSMNPLGDSPLPPQLQRSPAGPPHVDPADVCLTVSADVASPGATPVPPHINTPPTVPRPSDYHLEVVPPVDKLVLNKTNISLPTVSRLLHVFDKVSELHLSFNNYDAVDLPRDVTLPSVSRLLLNGNRLHSTEHLNRLACVFPELVNLVLIENHFSELGEPEQWCSAFTALKYLNLSNNRLTDISELQKLRRLQKLTDLRISDNPATPLNVKSVRRMIIAYLPEVTRLNGTPISDTEREDSERDFIRHFETNPPQPDRYHELLKRHGRVHQLAEVDLRPPDSVELRAHYQGREHAICCKLQTTVRELRRQVGHVIGVAPNQIRLFLDREDGQGHSELRIQTTSLLRLNVEDGFRVHVDQKLN